MSIWLLLCGCFLVLLIDKVCWGYHSYIGSTCYVISSLGRIYMPRASFVVDPTMAYMYGEPDDLASAFVKTVSRGPHAGCKKDAFIALEMRKKWTSVFPPEGRGEGGRVIYIDDDPVSLDALPHSVTVVKLPPEGEGVLSPQGRKAMARAGVDLATLGPQDVVVWDFDCTLSSIHLWKTLNMRRTTEPGFFPTNYEQVWGGKLMRWWKEQASRARDVLSTKVRGKIETKAPSPSSNVVVFQDDEYSFTNEI